MMSTNTINLTDLVPEFPNRPIKEISKDSFIRLIMNEFGPECQKVLIASGPLTGKTNFIAQFASYNENRVISYFITSNPLTQDLRTFLYVICNQMYHLLGKPDLPENIGLDELKNTFPGLSISLANDAKKKGVQYYFAIDGLEWGILGEKGNRIIDYPLLSFAKSPYILSSCRLDRIDSLPVDGFKVRDNIGHYLEFNLGDTQEVLSELQLSYEDIKTIHNKAKGLAGYVKIIHDTIKSIGTHWITSGDLPSDLEALIKKQLKLIYDNAPPQIVQAIETTAVSPKPIRVGLLASFLNLDEKALLENINKTGLSLHNKEKNTIEISSEYTREAILGKIGPRKSRLAEDLLSHARSTTEDDELLTALLLRETKDYQGLASILEPAKIISVFDRNNAAGLLSKQMRIAFEMAYDSKDVLGLLKWGVYLKTIKTAIYDSVDSKEVSALIAIGDSQTALRSAYTFPDSITKIQLLARAYAKMKEKNERIPINALEELKLLIDNQELDEYDKDTLRGLAADLFSVLPDKAIDILERRFAKDGKSSDLDIAIMNNTDKDVQSIATNEPTKLRLSIIGGAHSNWLEELTFEQLYESTNDLGNIKAKEYMIREWCSQHRNNPELHKGIKLWIDTVVSDSSYSIPLRSLRKISNSLKHVEKEHQEKLVYKLEIPTFYSLRTPWEEWIGFHLNIAEILYTHNKKLSLQRIDQIHETINLDISDQDIKVFCYARLWITTSKYHPEIEQSVKFNFERVLSSLLQDSALHDEILNKTLQIITPIDITFAIEKALEMNTKGRRQTAIYRIIDTSLRRVPSRDITPILDKFLTDLDFYERDLFILKITDGLKVSKVKLGEMNQTTLLKHTRKISGHAMRAEALSNLITIWDHEKLIRTEKIVNEITSAWEQEADLKRRLSLGYDIVENLAYKTKESAKRFLDKVQELYMLPGAALASGTLGSLFYYAVDSAIGTLTLREISHKDGVLENVYSLINRIPASRIRANLYGQVVARSYTLGFAKEAEESVRNRLLPEIKKIDNSYDRSLAIQRNLPVIYKYHKQTAFELANEMPESLKNNAWLTTTLWAILKGRLDSFEANVDHLKIPCDYLTLKDSAYEAATKITKDMELFMAIAAICRSIEQSIKLQKIDPVQAHSLLQMLQELASSKLPDKHNIQHNGYLVISLATINGARSVVYKSVGKKRNLSKIDIRKDWDYLEISSKNIPNAADRAFVMQYVAKEMYKYNEERSMKLLEDADDQINNIPAIIDRADRLEEVGKVWGIMGKKDLAKYALEKMSTLVEQMNEFTQDQRLETLAQAAYEFSPEFAEHLVERYDSRYPDEALNPARIQNEIQKLTYSPETVLRLPNNVDISLQLRIALASSADMLYSDVVLGHGRIPPNNVLLEWLKLGEQIDESGFLKITQWIQECMVSQPASYEFSHIFTELAELIVKIASRIIPARNIEIPDDIANILPGLSSKVFVFRVGEFEKARQWLGDWLRKHATSYIKLVDPYFSLEQLTFLTDVPKECKILIVTTDKNFKDSSLNSQSIREKMEYTWRQYGKGLIPQISLLIVPLLLEDLFHDRVLITKERGLDLGQSLNGLGNKIGKITDLPYEDAKELENKYVDDMLNHNNWFINHDIQPTIIRTG